MKMSLKFVPKGSLNHSPALVQLMAWCRLGHKPLAEQMMVSLLTHICVTRPQWIDKIFIIPRMHLFITHNAPRWKWNVHISIPK